MKINTKYLRNCDDFELILCISSILVTKYYFQMYLPPLYTYPLVSSLLLPATFLLTYTLSVSLGHTELDWPYISDTATRFERKSINQF